MSISHPNLCVIKQGLAEVFTSKAAGTVSWILTGIKNTHVHGLHIWPGS